MRAAIDHRVYPHLGDLLKLRPESGCFDFLTKRRVRGSLTGNVRSVVRGRGLDFQEIRHYRAGDDIRLIDWPATLRTGHAHVRAFNDERDLPVIVVVDLRTSMFFGSEYRTKSATAIILAGLVVWHTVASGDRLGAVVVGSDSLTEFAPRRGQDRSLRVLRDLVAAGRQLHVYSPPDSEGAHFEHAISTVERLVTHDHTVVVISDFSNLQMQTLLRLGRMTAHNDVFAIFVHDPLELVLPDSSAVTVSNGMDWITVDLRSARLRKEFVARQESTRVRLTGDLEDKGVTVMQISAALPVTTQIRKLNATFSQARPD